MLVIIYLACSTWILLGFTLKNLGAFQLPGAKFVPTTVPCSGASVDKNNDDWGHRSLRINLRDLDKFASSEPHVSQPQTQTQQPPATLTLAIARMMAVLGVNSDEEDAFGICSGDPAHPEDDILSGRSQARQAGGMTWHHTTLDELLLIYATHLHSLSPNPPTGPFTTPTHGFRGVESSPF